VFTSFFKQANERTNKRTGWEHCDPACNVVSPYNFNYFGIISNCFRPKSAPTCVTSWPILSHYLMYSSTSLRIIIIIIHTTDTCTCGRAGPLKLAETERKKRVQKGVSRFEGGPRVLSKKTIKIRCKTVQSEVIIRNSPRLIISLSSQVIDLEDHWQIWGTWR